MKNINIETLKINGGRDGQKKGKSLRWQHKKHGCALSVEDRIPADEIDWGLVRVFFSHSTSVQITNS